MPQFPLPFRRTRPVGDSAARANLTGADETSPDAGGWLTVSLPAHLRTRIEESAALNGLPADAWVYRSTLRASDR